MPDTVSGASKFSVTVNELECQEGGSVRALLPSCAFVTPRQQGQREDCRANPYCLIQFLASMSHSEVHSRTAQIHKPFVMAGEEIRRTIQNEHMVSHSLRKSCYGKTKCQLPPTVAQGCGQFIFLPRLLPCWRLAWGQGSCFEKNVVKKSNAMN